jgi:hypothetical protein
MSIYTAIGFVGVLVLGACGSATGQASRTSPTLPAFPSAVASPSPSPVVTLPPLAAGWTWYTDNQRGYSVGIAPEWTARSQLGLACPYFVSNPGLLVRWDPRQARPTDEGFDLCAGPATSCQTPHDNGPYTPITVAGVETNESTLVINNNKLPNGFSSYSVYLPANGLCYELHLLFMPGVSEQRMIAVRADLWSSFMVYKPGTPVASSARTT